jgi:hypothetical protein
MIGPLPILVFVLCFCAAAACTWLLLRGYWRSRTRLLFWSGLCFAFLSVNSLAVVLDLLVFPNVSLIAVRQIASLAAVITLLFGLVWETE